MLGDLSVLLTQLIKSAVVDALREVERSSSPRADASDAPRVDESIALLSKSEVAKVLGVSERHVRRLTVANKLPSIRLVANVRYRASSLRDWMAAREMGTESLVALSSEVAATEPQKQKSTKGSTKRSRRVKPSSDPSQAKTDRSSRTSTPQADRPRRFSFKDFVTDLGVPFELLGPVTSADIRRIAGISEDELTGWLFLNKGLPGEALARLQKWVLSFKDQ